MPGTYRRALAILATAATVAVAVGAGTPVAAAAGPDRAARSGTDVLGSWTGTLRQRGVAPFRIWVTIRSLSRRNAAGVRYSGLNCRGHWRYLGRRHGAWRFREIITRGRNDACTGVGTVTLRRAPRGRLKFRFVGGDFRSQGIIRRVSPSFTG